MKARVKLVEGMTFVAESGSGHAVVMDAAPDVGGRDMGARPMEMVLMGAGGCSAIDVVHILRKARQNLVDCVVELEAERAEEDPKVFTRPWQMSMPLYRRIDSGLQLLEYECYAFDDEFHVSPPS